MVFQREYSFSQSVLDFEAQASLSFCDLPIAERCESRNMTFEKQSTPDKEFEFFEFFNDFGVDMCAADDVFFRGKLLPYKSSISNAREEGEVWNSMKKGFFRKRSESTDKLHETHAKGRAMRDILLVDYRRLEKASSAKIPSTPIQTQTSKWVSGDRKASKPKWYFLMFGSMMTSVKMEMNDIRSRQRRKTPSPPVSAFDGGVAGSKNGEEGKSSWKLLRALSCKGHTSAVVASARPLELQTTRVRTV